MHRGANLVAVPRRPLSWPLMPSAHAAPAHRCCAAVRVRADDLAGLVEGQSAEAKRPEVSAARTLR
eukprot:1978345-Pleurochrysis_carterae.AAC.2